VVVGRAPDAVHAARVPIPHDRAVGAAGRALPAALLAVAAVVGAGVRDDALPPGERGVGAAALARRLEVADFAATTLLVSIRSGPVDEPVVDYPTTV
jgi:hypothetical protein